MWDAATTMDADGWTAEIWIPFAQLRFNPEQDLHVGPERAALPPDAQRGGHWVLIPRTVRAWSSRFGELRGVSDVPAARGASSCCPTWPAAATLYPARAAATRFATASNLVGRVGADVKMGLGPNLTLEATINPDFGQVEADPAEVNLTAFETRFPERRPFFLEGAPLFNIGHPNFYYSRRIGARPIGPATGDYVDYPDQHHDPRRGEAHRPAAVEDVDRVPDGGDGGGVGGGRLRDAPRSQRRAAWRRGAYYALGRVLQEFGPQASTAGLLASVVHRDFADGDPLADLQPENALARGRQHAAALQRRPVRAARGGRRLARERHGGGHRARAAIERALRAAARPDLLAARPDADVARRLDRAGATSIALAAGTGCGAPTPRSTRRTSRPTTSRT